MVNEMGNTNSSADQVDTQQKGEAAGNANGVGKENNIIREGESKEYHEKAAALPTHETSTDKEPHLENSEDDKADEDKKETQLNHTFQGSEVQTDANDSVSEVTNTETQTSPRKDELHDQPYKKKGDEEGSLPHDDILKSDPVKYSSVATETVDKHFISSSCEEQETPENGSSGQNEEKSQLITEIAFADKTVSDANDQNVTTQREELLAGELVSSGDISNEEKHVPMSADNQVENGYSIRADLDETPKVEFSQSDAAGSLLADNPQITPLSSFAAVVDPEYKCMVHTPDTELISNELENAEKKCNVKETESFMQAVHEMQNDNAVPSIESQPKETTEETASGDINVQPGILHYDDAPPVEQHVNSEENFEMVPEIGVLPTKFIGTATNLEEESSTENGLVEKEKEGVENSSRKEIMEECILQLGSSKPENAVHIAYADGRMQGFESVEDQKERNICEFGVTEDSGVFELNILKEIPKIEDFTETENAQNVQPSLDALAFSNEKCAFDQMVPNIHYNTPIKAPESIGRLSIQSIPEKSSNGIELRKSPSFDFGVNRRSSESDQTPLLCPEKTPTRSLSVGSNSIMRTEYKRSSLDYEAVAVKEKTIRMERSDSDISNVPLLGLSNKRENGDLKVTSETEQNHVAVMKGEDLQALHEKETSLTSPKVSGKRKPSPSFFTTCICCTAANHY